MLTNFGLVYARTHIILIGVFDHVVEAIVGPVVETVVDEKCGRYFHVGPDEKDNVEFAETPHDDVQVDENSFEFEIENCMFSLWIRCATLMTLFLM